MAADRSEQGWGRWANAADDLATYRYLGCRSEALDPDHAVGHMLLRSDMRWSGGLLGTPLAVAMLDTAGISIDGVRFAALTHVALQVHHSGAGIRGVRVDGQVARIARRMLFTEAVLRDLDHADRVIATGAADWVSLGKAGPEWSYIDPGPGVRDEPPMPPLAEAYRIQVIGGRYTIAKLSPTVGDRLLHHGPQMAALEWHAMELAEEGKDDDCTFRLSTFDVRLLRAGTEPPFSTKPIASGRSDDAVWAQVHLVDARDAVISSGSIVYRALTP